MASKRSNVDFIVCQLRLAGDVRAKLMFGDYAVYCNEKVVAMIADDQLYVKPTPAGRAFATECGEASPYPGAKPHLLVPEARWNDDEWLCELVRITESELPAKKKK